MVGSRYGAGAVHASGSDYADGSCYGYAAGADYDGASGSCWARFGIWLWCSLRCGAGYGLGVDSYYGYVSGAL